MKCRAGPRTGRDSWTGRSADLREGSRRAKEPFTCVSQVLLCASNQNGSIVECWSLRKEGLPVNNIFQHRSPVGKSWDWLQPRASRSALLFCDFVFVQLGRSSQQS